MTKRKIKIIPSLLALNKAEFIKQFKKVSPYFKCLQIDIMDGHLVKAKNTLTPQSIKNLTRQHKLEIHLMVKDLPRHINSWLKLKNVQKIIWHYEADKNLRHITFLNKYLKAHKIKTGLALNPNTSLAKIKNLIAYFDTIQLMGVTPGRQGQKFETKIIPKIKALRYKFPKINIEIDGGVNNQTFHALVRAGANIVCPGSYFQKSTNIRQALNKLK